MASHLCAGADNDGKGWLAGVLGTRWSPDGTGVKNLFDAGKFQHACTHCQATMKVCA